MLPSSSADSSVLYDKLEYLAAGKSGVVYRIDDGRILKQYYEGCDGDGDVERRAYERLGLHPNIARYLGNPTDDSIILERGEGLRTICSSHNIGQIPLRRKLRWLRQAAEGLQYIHEKGIIHADVGCSNMILTSNDCLKIIDFEGCSIDGEPASSCYDWFSYRPSEPRVNIQTDIFAYGCMIYEVVAGRPPYYELKTSDNQFKQVEQLYERNQFPDVSQLPLGELMRGCWRADFNSMSEVIQELEALSSFKEKFSAPITRILKCIIGCSGIWSPGG